MIRCSGDVFHHDVELGQKVVPVSNAAVAAAADPLEIGVIGLHANGQLSNVRPGTLQAMEDSQRLEFNDGVPRLGGGKFAGEEGNWLLFTSHHLQETASDTPGGGVSAKYELGVAGGVTQRHG
jgi:hypothetical protein